MFARLRTFGHLYALPATVDCRYLNIATDGCSRHRNWHTAEKIGVITLEDRVILNLDKDIEIARRTAAQTSFAFAT